jgi:hypothetical protein
MKQHSRDQIIRALGLQTHRRSEFDLLLILERLQSEDLIGEEREFALSELFSQYLEVLRLRAGVRGQFNIRGFRLHHAELCLEWISGHNNTTDGLREILDLLDSNDCKAIQRLVHELIEHEHRRPSMEQSRRASVLRKLNPFNQIIYNELNQRWPEPLSEPELMEVLKRMAGRSIVSRVSSVVIELDDPDSGYSKDFPVSGVRRRLTDMRKRVEAEKSR